MNKSIYLFYGEEDFLIDEKIDELKSRVENPALNFESLSGENITLEKLSSALCSQSLLGGDKMVVVSDLSIGPDDQDGMISLLKNLSPGVKVIFRSPGMDKRSKFYRLLSDQGEVYEFKTFAPWEQKQLQDWIRERAKRQGKKITDDGAQQLAEICGNNLRQLASEIEKLATYAGERGEIKADDVNALASPGEKTGFDLLDALRAKDLKSALSLFQVLIRNKEDLFQLLGSIVSQYRMMLQIKSLPKKEEDPYQIARVLGGSPYYIRKCLQGIDRFTVQELKRDMELLLEANLKLKTGVSQPAVFEILLAELCHGK